jgi:hypothetical protein
MPRRAPHARPRRTELSIAFTTREPQRVPRSKGGPSRCRIQSNRHDRRSNGGPPKSRGWAFRNQLARIRTSSRRPASRGRTPPAESVRARSEPSFRHHQPTRAVPQFKRSAVHPAQAPPHRRTSRLAGCLRRSRSACRRCRTTRSSPARRSSLRGSRPVRRGAGLRPGCAH